MKVQGPIFLWIDIFRGKFVLGKCHSFEIFVIEHFWIRCFWVIVLFLFSNLLMYFLCVNIFLFSVYFHLKDCTLSSFKLHRNLWLFFHRKVYTFSNRKKHICILWYLSTSPASHCSVLSFEQKIWLFIFCSSQIRHVDGYSSKLSILNLLFVGVNWSFSSSSDKI